MDLEVALDARAELGEGVTWDPVAQRVIWVDIMRGRVHVFDPPSGACRTFPVGQPVGAAVPRAAGGLVLAVRDGFARLDLATGRMDPVAVVEAENPPRRMNDGACDAGGRFWAGTMALDERAGAGALYRLDPDGRVHRMLDEVTISNGIDWSLDGSRMFYIDTGTRRIDVFDFDPESGTIANRRPFVTIDAADGAPDGMTIDAEGGVWVALWGGGAVRRYDADGRLDLVIDLPVSHPTNCAFGGADLRDLYITTATIQLSPAQRASQPAAGALFRCRPGVAGRAAHAWRG
jgi:sugar lactone lactonase YvrE